MAAAAMANTGQATASSSISARLSITSVSVMVWNVAVATVLPNTSCAQVNVEGGVTVTSMEIRRRSRLSRGRSIRRCAPRLTGCR